MRSRPRPSLLMAEEPQYSQPFFMCQTPQSFKHFLALFWTLFSLYMPFFLWWEPNLNTVFQMWPDKHWKELDNDFFSSADNAPVDHTLVAFLVTAAQWPLDDFSLVCAFGFPALSLHMLATPSKTSIHPCFHLWFAALFALSSLSASQIRARTRGFPSPSTSFPFRGNLFLCFQESVFYKTPALASSFILHGNFPWNPSQLISEWAEVFSSETKS